MPTDRTNAAPEAPIFYAHRGASLELPENTLESFARALELGAQVLETDVHLTRDRVVVHSHDPTGMRAAGVPDTIASRTLAEVKRWDAGRGFTDASGARTHVGRGFTIPTLEETLRTFAQARFNIDIKREDPTAADEVVATVRRAGASDRVLLTSFHCSSVARVRALGYEGALGLCSREVLAMLALPAAAAARYFRERVARAGRDAKFRAQIPHRYGAISLGVPSVLARFHALGVPVDYWTVNDPWRARALLSLGCDGVMTDDPAAIAPVFRERASWARGRGGTVGAPT